MLKQKDSRVSVPNTWPRLSSDQSQQLGLWCQPSRDDGDLSHHTTATPAPGVPPRPHQSELIRDLQEEGDRCWPDFLKAWRAIRVIHRPHEADRPLGQRTPPRVHVPDAPILKRMARLMQKEGPTTRRNTYEADHRHLIAWLAWSVLLEEEPEVCFTVWRDALGVGNKGIHWRTAGGSCVGLRCRKGGGPVFKVSLHNVNAHRLHWLALAQLVGLVDGVHLVDCLGIVATDHIYSLAPYQIIQNHWGTVPYQVINLKEATLKGWLVSPSQLARLMKGGQ